MAGVDAVRLPGRGSQSPPPAQSDCLRPWVNWLNSAVSGVLTFETFSLLHNCSTYFSHLTFHCSLFFSFSGVDAVKHQPKPEYVGTSPTVLPTKLS